MAAPSTLTLRVLSSCVLIPLVLGILAIGGWPFGVFLAVVIGIAVAEWVNLSLHATTNHIMRGFLIVLGLAYLGISFYEMAALRLLFPYGFMLTIGLFLTVWASDSGAYLFGKKLGGPKMTPTISPNKTWAGLLGSVLCAALTLATYSYLFLADKSIPLALGFGAGIGLIGQSGDLLISWFKRHAGLKDTGHLIPGHGGILDRIDALLLILPAYLGFAKFVLAL